MEGTSSRNFRHAGLLLSGAAVLIPFYIVISAAWPGLYTVDSLKQLRQAMSGAYTDLHPPVMAWLWRGLLWLTGHPASLFLFYTALLGLGLLVWLYVFRRIDVPEAYPFLAIAAWNPAILNFAGVVGKDEGLVVALLLGFATVAVLKRSDTLPSVLVKIGVIFLFVWYAVGVRWNGVFAVIPLLYLAALPLLPFRGWRKHAAAGSTALICSVLFFIGNLFFTYGFLNAERDEFGQLLRLYDLAGMEAKTGKSVIPDEFKGDTFTLAALRKVYTPESLESIFVAADYLNRAPLVTVDNVDDVFGKTSALGGVIQRRYDPASLSKLSQAWLGAIRESPGVYLRHRVTVFLALLRVGYDSPYVGYVPILDSFKLWPSRWPGGGAATELLQVVFKWANETPLFVGWFWVIVLVLVTSGGALIVSTPAGRITTAVGASGLIYIAPYIIVSIAADFRYLYWSVVAATLGTVILCGVGVRKARLRFVRSRDDDRPSSAMPAGGLGVMSGSLL